MADPLPKLTLPQRSALSERLALPRCLAQSWAEYAAPLAALAAMGLFVAALVGCNATVRKPNLGNPGNLAQQQYDAVIHDPYPLNDVGPDVVGGRPRHYQNPVPEVRRARLFSPPQTVAPPR